MGRWTQYDEDSYRLPEGVTRIAYDADTGQYTFRDRAGGIFIGAPGERYGYMEPVSSHDTISRPLFETDEPLAQSSSDSAPATFHDILPPDLISSATKASPPSSPPAHSCRTEPSRFVKAVRRTAMPKVYIVAQNLRRSATMGKRPVNGETERLLRKISSVSEKTAGGVSRSQSVDSSYASVSTSTPLSEK